jgi:glycosyltransferase involved in cell wall biosynthesis
MSSGGFPLQMRAIRSLFDEMVLVVGQTGEGEARTGGTPLPEGARVVSIHQPAGEDLRRKLSVVLLLPYYLWKIGSNMRTADVVHVPLPGDIPLIAMVMALFARKRVLARYGGSWPTNAQTTRMNRITKGLMRRFSGGRHVMLATGAGVGDAAEGVHWIFSTALTDGELALLRPPLERGLSQPSRMIYVGRLSEEKGVATLIRAMAILEREGESPVPRLTIAGDGSELGALERLAEQLDVRHLIDFRGQLDREALSAELLRADFCVQPSLTEGFSKAWLDAMAHGLPVLASEVGAARDVIGGDGARGWLVPPGDERALARALREVVTGERDWASLRKRCRVYVEGKTLERWARQIGEYCAAQWGWCWEGGKLRP